VPTAPAKSMIFSKQCLQHKQNQLFSAKGAYSTSKINDFQLKVHTVQAKSTIFG